MKKVYITLIMLGTSVTFALHVNLDPAKKIDFAQKRRAMMNKEIETKNSQINSIEKVIASLKNGNGNPKDLPPLEAQLTHLKEESTQLGHELKITENSIKALIAKK